MKFYIVDAFSDQIVGGNPVDVVLIEENSIFQVKKARRDI